MNNEPELKDKVKDAFDFLSCDKFTVRVSKDLDGQLPWYEKPAYWLRLLLCSTSRTFRRQLCSMDDISNGFGCRLRESAGEETEVIHSLSPDASERIKQALQDHSTKDLH